MFYPSIVLFLFCTPAFATDGGTHGSEADTESESSRAGTSAGSALLAPRFYWADYDGDGQLDAFVVASEGGARLLHNIGSTEFEDVTLEAGLAALGDEANQAAWGDYDGDGRIDLFIASYTGQSRLMRQTEGGHFDDVTQVSGLPRLARVLDVTWLDSDGDGRSDLFVTTLNGARLFRNTGGVFLTLDLGRVDVGTRVLPDQLPATIEAARLLRGLPPLTSGLPSVSAPSSAIVTTQPICADTIRDSGTFGDVCLSVSSVPTLGSLMPLNSFFHVTTAGNVGIGTITPSTTLEVAGVAKVSGFQMPAGAGSGLVMTSDSSGSGSWSSAPVGATGPTGAQGPTGPQGAAGATGSQGAQGPVGATGAQGVQGLAGATGSPGAQGPAGATGLQGAQGPAGATGSQGAQGPAGATGAQGVQGPAGATGSQGPAGATGQQGAQGAVGATGAQGVQGLTGATGSQGAQGPVGATGSQGPLGPPGPVGPIGPTGLLIGGSTDQIPRYDGTTWVGSSTLVNDGTNVGIGTASPNAKLEVIGDGRISDSLIIGSSFPFAELTVDGSAFIDTDAIVPGTVASGFANTGDGIVQGDLGVGGDLDVAGMLSKGGGTFKIDHPLDPAGKYLFHSFVESPDMKNVYDGTVVLDSEGKAWVSLPDWFEALNDRFRYQLTPIDAPAPMLYVSERIRGNRFQIAGGPAGLDVSWQVTGIRKDAFAQAHRVQVEVEKPSQERGLYLHPRALGLPDERGVHYEAKQAHKQRLEPDQKD